MFLSSLQPRNVGVLPASLHSGGYYFWLLGYLFVCQKVMLCLPLAHKGDHCEAHKVMHITVRCGTSISALKNIRPLCVLTRAQSPIEGPWTALRVKEELLNDIGPI